MKRIILLFILLLFSEVLTAQAQSVQLVTPASPNGVALTSRVRISASSLIDTVSIKWGNKLSDSTRDLQHPTILVVEKSLPDSVKLALHLADSGWIVNDSTIELVTREFRPGVEYEITVKGLRVFQGGGFVEIAETTFDFTSALSAFAPKGFSGLNNQHLMSCNDTLFVDWNQKLASHTSSSGALIDLFELFPTDSLADTTGSLTFSPVSFSYTTKLLSTDSSKLIVTSNSFTPGDNYLFRINGSKLSGDTLHNRVFPLKVRDRMNVQLSAYINNEKVGSDKLRYFDPTFRDKVLELGDTLHLQAPSYVAGAVFSHWECDADNVIDSNTSLDFKRVWSCENLTDIDVKAKYTLTVDTLCVSVQNPTGSFGQVRVYSEGLIDTVILSTTYFHIARNTLMTLIPYTSDTNYAFSTWLSAKPSINGSTSRPLQIVSTANLCVTANIVSRPTASYEICAEMSISIPFGFRPPLSTEAIVTVPSPTKCTTTVNSVAVATQIRILVPTLGIKGYHIIRPTGSSTVVFPEMLDVYTTSNGYYSAPELTLTTNPATVVYYMLDELEYKLDVELAMEDGSEPHRSASRLTLNAEPKLMYVTGNYAGTWSIRTAWSSTHPFESVSSSVQKDVVITMNAGAEIGEGYEFVRWEPALPPFTATSATPTLQVTMNQNHRVRAVFREKFRLKHIKFIRSVAHGVEEEVTVTPEEWGQVQKDVFIPKGTQLLPRPTAWFELHFNQDIPMQNGWAGRVEELSEPLDIFTGHRNQVQFIVNRSALKVDDKVLKVFAVPLWKFQQGRILISEFFRSSSGEKLPKDYSLMFETIGPDASWRIEWYKVKDGIEESSSDPVPIVAGTVHNKETKVLKETNRRWADDDDFDYGNSNYTYELFDIYGLENIFADELPIIEPRRLGHNDVINAGSCLFESDGGDVEEHQGSMSEKGLNKAIQNWEDAGKPLDMQIGSTLHSESLSDMESVWPSSDDDDMLDLINFPPLGAFEHWGWTINKHTHDKFGTSNNVEHRLVTSCY